VISFRTTHEGFSSRLNPGDYIKVAMDETEYDEFTNGVVTGSGALVSTTALDDGTYDVLAWDGVDGNEPADATLTVSDNGATATPTGIIFTVKKASTQIRVYQVERISPDDDGTFTIEAMYMPLNSSGVTKVAEDFDNNGSWVITPPCSAISTTPDACVPTLYFRECSTLGTYEYTGVVTNGYAGASTDVYYVLTISEEGQTYAVGADANYVPPYRAIPDPPIIEPYPDGGSYGTLSAWNSSATLTRTSESCGSGGGGGFYMCRLASNGQIIDAFYISDAGLGGYKCSDPSGSQNTIVGSFRKIS